ncbi:hypothetical protein BGW80DRAFT_1298580, partial [Lactifluus volemus]
MRGARAGSHTSSFQPSCTSVQRSKQPVLDSARMCLILMLSIKSATSLLLLSPILQSVPFTSTILIFVGGISLLGSFSWERCEPH